MLNTTMHINSTPPAQAKLEKPRSSRLAVHALIACWLGMVFDGMDTNNYILTLHPVLKELLHTTNDASVGACGANILATFMIGWAVGAVIFGLLADHFGRSKTLIFTVLLYAACTGLCAGVHTWQELMALRFLVGCGIGGEISIGGVILAELWSHRSRLHATAVLQTGFPCGLLLLAALNLCIGNLGWRWLYLAGMVPALLAIYMRLRLKESEDFEKVSAYRESLIAKSKSELSCDERRFLGSPFKELFRGENLSKTVVVAGLASCVCIGAYAVLSWLPPWINQLTGTLAIHERSYAAISQSLGNIVGTVTAGFVVMLLGRKWAFRISFVMACIVCGAMFLTTKAFGPALLIYTFFAGCFVFAPFAYLFIYVPELFETRLRATAFAFCIQSGRLLCAAACLASGFLIAGPFHGSYALAGATMALVYILGLVITLVMPKSCGMLGDRQ